VSLGREAEHRAQLGHDPDVPFQVRLVDDEDVGNLKDPGLDHLDAIPEVRCQHHNGRVCHSGHLEL